MSAELDKIHQCDDWISCPVADAREAALLCDTLRAHDKWTEVVQGIDSVAVQFDPSAYDIDEAKADFATQLVREISDQSVAPAEIVIPVCYEATGSLDHELIARKLGLDIAEIPAWHSAQSYRVSMLGFMPGFAYLQSETATSDIGRLATPRTHVEAGSIGIMGSQSCIYSFASPGGWPIIGRTPVGLFNHEQTPPALLAPRQSVRFEAIDSQEFDRLRKAQS